MNIMLLMLLVVRIYGIKQFEEVCLVAGFTVSEADQGMGAGCVQPTPPPPLAPKPFWPQSEWMNSAIYGLLGTIPPPPPPQWDPGSATEYIWKVLHIYCHWICSVTHTEQLRELHGVCSIQTTVTAFLYVKCYTHTFPQPARALN